MLILSRSVFSVHSGILLSSSVGHYMHRAPACQILRWFSSFASTFSLIFFLCVHFFKEDSVLGSVTSGINTTSLSREQVLQQRV